MKKYIIIILLFILILPAFPLEDNCEIQFIYINGSNNNDKKMKKWFYDGMNKMHKNMLKAFNNSQFIKSILLENGKYRISYLPEAFFWGDKSNAQIKAVNADLKTTKVFSPKIAQKVRALLAYYVHDAIWVSHYRNMHPIVDDLHKQILKNKKQGKKVVLLGYSAGAFISYEYLFTKLPYINLQDFIVKSYKSEELIKFIKKQKCNNTCIDALTEAQLAIYGADGRLIPAVQNDILIEQYLKLDDYTEKYCTPKGTVKGIINFASPLLLFYSDLNSPDNPMTYYNKLLYKYLLENNMFWLTVNYSDDPMGYPVAENLSYYDLKDKEILNIRSRKGFVYSRADEKSRRTFLGAHTSYWATSKRFAKLVVNAFEQGYKLYNDNDL